jgi:hypothetical protein
MKHIFNKSTLNLLIAVSFVLANNNVFSQEEWEHHWGFMETDNPMTKNTPHSKHSFTNPDKSVRIEKTSMGTFLINPNFMVHPNDHADQAEVILVRNRQVPNIMFGSATTFWPVGGPAVGKSQGIYVSTDGGASWFGTDTINTGSPAPQPGSDPGPVIDKDGRFIISSILVSGGVTSGLVANYSTDNGVTWSAPYTIMSGSTPDKNMTGTDDVPTSPYYGRTYTAWLVLGTGTTYFSYTTNGGVSWSAPASVGNAPAGNRRAQGVDVRCGLNGEVYLVWAAAIVGSPPTENYNGFAKSTDGGISWSVTQNICDANGIGGFLPTKGNIRVNSWPRMDVDKSGGPRNGWIYVVGCDRNLAPAGSDPDIIFHRSTDGGTTWSQAIRVNQDPLNNGAIQFFPAIEVDDGGGINIVYYDDRNVGGQLTEVYISRSTDGGDTWVDFPVSDHSFTVAPRQGSTNGFMGDYIGICYSNGKLWPFWMDNYSGHLQAWTTSVDVVTGVEPTSGELAESFSLSQNYPNPFNPSTNIGFRIQVSGFTSLRVYDVLGREVATLVNEELPAGEYTRTWDATGHASGVYFYRLAADGFVQTRKLVLTK